MLLFSPGTSAGCDPSGRGQRAWYESCAFATLAQLRAQLVSMKAELDSHSPLPAH